MKGGYRALGQMLLPDLLDIAARRFPDKSALVRQQERISFGRLDRESWQVAARLRRLEIGPGDRVAIISDNALASVVYYWGILKAGAESVDIPAVARHEMIEAALNECRPAAAVIGDSQLARLTGKRKTAGLPDITLLATDAATDVGLSAESVHTLTNICETEPITEVHPSVQETDVAMVIYTSGTTGLPKGVMLSHQNLLSNVSASNQYMRLTSDDSILIAVPLYFIHGRMQLLTHMLIGGTAVFSAGFQFPAEALRELSEHRVTGFSGVPYFFSSLLHRGSLAKSSLPDLRYLLITGGSLSTQALSNLAGALPDAQIHLAYGQTEASPRITHLAPEELFARPGSCGRPLPGVKVEILDEDANEVPPGEVGEVVVTGPNVMCGYVSGDERDEGVIDSVGRLHTGDLGFVDADGFLYLVDRISQMIKSAGERIFPREIEDVIDCHFGVAESAVFGVPDLMLGEKMVAWIVPEPGIDLSVEMIRTHCLQQLPYSRSPREIEFATTLPKTASGKIDRKTLRALYARREGSQDAERR